ncbi:hypothetical protein B0H14DRAFT_3497814 [Mycena olivaceomarginata]|nr:hypothetical protein B0H14DRAFT_3497814 [Mycena olivaceomarginata]
MAKERHPASLPSLKLSLVQQRLMKHLPLPPPTSPLFFPSIDEMGKLTHLPASRNNFPHNVQLAQARVGDVVRAVAGHKVRDPFEPQVTRLWEQRWRRGPLTKMPDNLRLTRTVTNTHYELPPVHMGHSDKFFDNFKLYAKNASMQLTISHKRITSPLDVQLDRELIQEGATGGLVIVEDCPSYWDACNVEIHHLEKAMHLESAGVSVVAQAHCVHQ